MTVVDLVAAQQLLETLERDAISARNRADIDGDVGDLSRLIKQALYSVPAARVLADEGARRELNAIDPSLGAALAPWFRGSFAIEAVMRGAVFQARGDLVRGSVPISGLMRAYRSREESMRREARAALDPLLDHLYDRTAVQQIIDRFEAPDPKISEPLAPIKPEERSASGLLVLPSAELIQGLAGGGTIDPRIFASTLAPEPAAVPTDTSAAQASSLPELLRALAESVLGEPATTFGEWRAACAAFHVADFRAGELPVLGRPRTKFLPFEAPGVPIYRPGATVRADSDAWSSQASLFGAGAEWAGLAFGGALAFGSATRSFVLRGLADRPGDPLRATRALALSSGFLFVARELDPPEALDRWWTAESSLARAPGEASAIYTYGAAHRDALLRGLSLVSLLRDTYDEDWFRNPRLTPDRLRELSVLAAPATENAVAAWLNEHARL